jgi:hypothetical protein
MVCSRKIIFDPAHVHQLAFSVVSPSAGKIWLNGGATL